MSAKEKKEEEEENSWVVLDSFSRNPSRDCRKRGLGEFVWKQSML